MNTKQNSDKREKALRIGGVVRSFSVGDWVVWKLSENCSKNNISKKGKVIEVLGDEHLVINQFTELELVSIFGLIYGWHNCAQRLQINTVYYEQMVI